jgi:hypothetical protein
MVRLGRYMHYSGRVYRVLFNAIHSEVLENVVVYRIERMPFSEQQVWVRPEKMFEEMVWHKGEEKPRFAFIEE